MPIILPFSPAEPVQPAAANPPSATDLNTSALGASESDALKAGEGAKINTLSATDLSGQSGSSGASGGSRVPLGGMIESRVAIELIDALVPALLVVLFRYAKMLVRKTDLQLSAKEKETLSPIVQACMDQLMLNFSSPWVALAVTGGMIYGSKVIEIMGTAQADKKNGVQTPKEAKSSPVEQSKAKDTPKQDQPPSKPPDGLRPFTQEDVDRIAIKKKKTRDWARDYLEKNWVKKGGNV